MTAKDGYPGLSQMVSRTRPSGYYVNVCILISGAVWLCFILPLSIVLLVPGVVVECSNSVVTYLCVQYHVQMDT